MEERYTRSRHPPKTKLCARVRAWSGAVLVRLKLFTCARFRDFRLRSTRLSHDSAGTAPYNAKAPPTHSNVSRDCAHVTRVGVPDNMRSHGFYAAEQQLVAVHVHMNHDVQTCPHALERCSYGAAFSTSRHGRRRGFVQAAPLHTSPHSPLSSPLTRHCGRRSGDQPLPRIATRGRQDIACA